MTIVAIPGGWIELRPLTGHDERSLAGVSVFDMVALIDRLALDRPGVMLIAGQAVNLTSAARDRVLACIYTQSYGDLIRSSRLCAACGNHYDLSFKLSDLLKGYAMQSPPADGIYQTAEGARFRLPTGIDELAVIGLPPQAARRALLKRCTVTEDADPDRIEAAMEAVAPLLSTELQAICPECATAELMDFDMGTYLLRRLLNDQERLPNEVHMLAMAYGWSHDNILDLTRAERRRYMALIEASLRQSRARPISGARRRLA